MTLQQQILSRSRLEPIIVRLGLYKDKAGKWSMEEMVERLRKSIDVQLITPEGSAVYLPASTSQRVLTPHNRSGSMHGHSFDVYGGKPEIARTASARDPRTFSLASWRSQSVNLTRTTHSLLSSRASILDNFRRTSSPTWKCSPRPEPGSKL